MTCETVGISRPRAATSVATRTSARPFRNSLREASRSRCSRSPWIATALKPARFRCISSAAAVLFIATKTSVESFGFCVSTSRTLLCLWWLSTTRKLCSTLSTAPPTRPTPTQMYFLMKACASFCISRGKVAENISVARPSCDEGMSCRSTMSRIWGSKPMSSIRSASSSTRCATSDRLTTPRLRKSVRRPGVAIMMSEPRASSLSCGFASTPPYTSDVRIFDLKESFRASRKICEQSSRVGARTTALGQAGAPTSTPTVPVASRSSM
mmetsp:Transcript_67998/g.191644  ORF Transcript_67998/g.191644 Transcript_67998/m.191644 type:complete len:268 (+) Transcript_67998:287-1090(+)